MSPEILLCPVCHERVDLDQHEYVVTNRDTARTRHNRLYAHFGCVRGHEKSVQDMSDMEVAAGGATQREIFTVVPEGITGINYWVLSDCSEINSYTGSNVAPRMLTFPPRHR